MFGCALILATLSAGATLADAADQQVGAPIVGADRSDLLGQQVAMSGDGTRIAASSTGGFQRGELLVFELQDGSWQPLGLPIGDVGDWPQTDLAISSDGSHIVIGSRNGGDGVSRRGEVNVYRFSNGDWRLVGNPIFGDVGDGGLGYAVAVSADGTRVVATSAVANVGNAGVVRVFDLVGGDWDQTGSITGSISFGESIAISASGTRFVTSFRNDAGGLFIYEEAGGQWQQVGESIPGTLSNEQLGRDVVMSADGTRVAARGLRSPDDPSAYYVSVFDEVDSQWAQVGNRLTGQTRTGTRQDGFDDNFAVSLSLSGDGNRLAIGAPGTGINGTLSGSVTVFDLDDITWRPIANFIGPHSYASMGLGVALDDDGSRVLLGTPNADMPELNNGRLTVFDLGVPGPLCGGMPATLVGTAGSDRLIGTSGNDVIIGLQGNDIIKGLAGDDIICSGSGDDIVFAGHGFDTVFGAQGDDLIYASNESTEFGRRDSRGARVFGGAGDDTIHGSNRWDRIRGGPGNDTLFSYEGRDWIRGGPGADLIDGGAMIDDLHGGNGNDVISVRGNDRVRGGAGANDRCEVAVGSTPRLISCELG